VSLQATGESGDGDGPGPHDVSVERAGPQAKEVAQVPAEPGVCSPSSPVDGFGSMLAHSTWLWHHAYKASYIGVSSSIFR
jgi:hypothetical protein